ncbi:MAG: hypothetical protein E6G20_06635 [Actinobacteria bacterium]|nr:MAG: hypothetical protein E6G20_06635 [Actinomycetota bacterium]
MVIDVGVVQEPRRANDLEPRRPGLDEEQELLVSGRGEHEIEAGVAFTRHEPLLAVQDPLVAFPSRGRLDAAHVRAGAGLRDRPCLAVLAPYDGSHEALDLRGRRDLE